MFVLILLNITAGIGLVVVRVILSVSTTWSCLLFEVLCLSGWGLLPGDSVSVKVMLLMLAWLTVIWAFFTLIYGLVLLRPDEFVDCRVMLMRTWVCGTVRLVSLLPIVSVSVLVVLSCRACMAFVVIVICLCRLSTVVLSVLIVALLLVSLVRCWVVRRV